MALELVPPGLLKSCTNHVERLNRGATVLDFQTASGGCINNGGKLTTTSGDYFLKWNSASKFPRMFDAERKGLDLLRINSSFKVPQVWAVDVSDPHSFLLLEYVEQADKEEDFYLNFAQQLAALHRVTAEKFGLDHDNFIGSLVQRNSQCTSWTEFFIAHRLEPQIKLAVDSKQYSRGQFTAFERLFARLDELLPQERPALLHGDLWGGNHMATQNKQACLYDPAVYFGHRECELAFTGLFNGYPREFISAYEDHHPLSPGFDKRADIYNLYPLMVHVNLFGGSYIERVLNTLRPF